MGNTRERESVLSEKAAAGNRLPHLVKLLTVMAIILPFQRIFLFVQIPNLVLFMPAADME